MQARRRRKPAISAARKSHQQVHVTKGKKIPICPHCGNDAFDTRYHEPGRKRG
jgi:hypothetical protein